MNHRRIERRHFGANAIGQTMHVVNFPDIYVGELILIRLKSVVFIFSHGLDTVSRSSILVSTLARWNLPADHERAGKV
jgi:hypothetical protein